MTISFTVQGVPCGKGRPRVYSRHAVTPEKTREYEKLVQQSYISQGGKKLHGCIEMRVTAFYAIPKNTPKWQRPLMTAGLIRPVKVPDWDNVGKIIADALNKVAYDDDAMIVDGMVRKFYSDEPRVEVTMTEADSFPPNVTRAEYFRLR